MGKHHEQDDKAIRAAIGITIAASAVMADEAGVSFWLPGNFGCLASVPGDADWSLHVICCHSKADEDAEKSFVNGGWVVAGVGTTGDFVFVSPGYTFASPVAGGQAAISVAAAIGRVDASIDATLTAAIGCTASGAENDARTGLSDLYPTVSLKWNRPPA